MAKKTIDYLLNLCSKNPSQSETDSYEKWLLYEDILYFLAKNKLDDEVVIYASTNFPSSMLLNSFFVPKVEVNPVNDSTIKEIFAWDFSPSAFWNINYTYPNKIHAAINDYDFRLEEESLTTIIGAKSISKNERILSLREFDGRANQKQYIEISQKILHSQDLHYVPECKAFCKFDHLGEIVKHITVHYKEERVIAVTARREVLEQFMAITDMILVRMFDVTRISKNFQNWDEPRKPILVKNKQEKIFGNGKHISTASYLRGFQIIDCKEPRENVLRNIICYNNDVDKRYVEFITHDWKNNLVCELSCDPRKLGNYFIKSELPYETSPAFFKKDVLLKYQNDPDKYAIDGRSISCRGGWSLKSYDLNDEDQVHAYLIDLGKLPYEEQLHWKVYNEQPKSEISKRAFINDFEGKIYYGYDPLHSLKSELKTMCNEQLNWYQGQSSELVDRVHYLSTSSQPEWEAAINNLNKLLVDGLNKKYITILAKESGVTIEANDGSLKILNKYLTQKEYDDQLISTIMNPLFELNKLRSNICAHNQSNGKILIDKVKNDYDGSLEKHFKNLIESCDQAIKELRKILK
ncbi:hypothetical protein Megvenef_01567 [Candidatus Megaera venefica]|uniref:Uncharacterized protein n=1 Tax=Candidatus Megaera venefica TaxID=2055910 RepID=A0ABU5NEK8_9RICK|nr:hypothetical protein [Candidatus Megaera venefica]MEA0971585.1 hypothetical protein [Candidatus Megaera venefica]